MEQADRDCIALDTGVLLDRQGCSTRLECSSTVAVHPGWMSVLASCSSMIAGPSITLPRKSLARSSTTVSRNPPAFTVAENNPSPNRLRPRQVGRMEARAEQNLGLADALKGSHDVQSEGNETSWCVFDNSRFACASRHSAVLL